MSVGFRMGLAAVALATSLPLARAADHTKDTRRSEEGNRGR